jgi:hypothetical protein
LNTFEHIGFVLQECGILLGSVFGDCYSITFGDGLVTVTPQPVTSNLSLLVCHHR